MQADIVTYVVQFFAAILYAIVLEQVFKRRYEPDYTWVTVVWGNAQVGGIIAVRLLLAPLPLLADSDLAWWGWGLWFWSFVASGLPIVFWQVIIQHRRHLDLMAFVGRWIGGAE